MCHFQIFDKTDSFLKNVSNVFDRKKVDCIYQERRNLHITDG